MNTNQFLKNEYDILINFIVIKNSNIEENLKFINSLHLYCNLFVKNLLHISSISVYNNEEILVNEESNIEFDCTKKGIYGSIKIECDKFLLNQKKNYNLTFIRPGYIVSSNNNISSSGIYFKLPFNFVLLLGNKKSTLPLIDLNKMHDAIARICCSSIQLPCYLLLENRGGTKYNLLKNLNIGKIIQLPSCILLPLSYLLYTLKIFNKTKYWQIKGLYKSTYFDSSLTESILKFSLTNKSIAIIGSGVYGSYAIRTITDKYPLANITLFELGNHIIKNEKEIGFSTQLLKEKYRGLSNGRFFGLGGTSNKWGGQLLFFSKNDFKNPPQFIIDLIEISDKYKVKILQKFKINYINTDKYINSNLFLKSGVWLSYFNRNLFKYFKINKLRNVRIEQNARVIKLISNSTKIVAAEFEQFGKIKIVYFDTFILVAGAFESNRILMQSGLVKEDKVYFSDHISKKVFRIIDKNRFKELDLKFKIFGSSLITKRIIGETNNYSYFANPVYNTDFPFFQILKKLLFNNEFKLNSFKNLFFDLPFVLKFIYSIIIYKEVYVYKDTWDLYIDIENPQSNSFISLVNNNNNSFINDLAVHFDLNKNTIEYIYSNAILEIKELLKFNNINYFQLNDSFSFEKLEDTYHPFNMFMSNSEDLISFYNRFESLLIINTGILPRAGGINPTAALFPIIDNYVDNFLFKKNK
jgi:hypothetical protein